MRVAVYSTRPYDERHLATAACEFGHELTFLESRLTIDTASLAKGYPVACAFVNDRLDANVLERLASGGTRLIALRSAGFNNVHLESAKALGLTVLRVPAYSPHAVAEHTVALILALNRKIHRAHARVREGNFALDGLEGFDLSGRTVGVIGTGRIGSVITRIMTGFGCRLLGHDIHPNRDCESLGMTYVPLDDLLRQSDIVTLHCPLTPGCHHRINDDAIALMKPGVMLINTSRGALIDTAAVIRGLKSGHIGYLGLDVYEEEADLFFEDLSSQVIQDDVFSRLLTFPNVIITGHQAFFTHDALEQIARTTMKSISAFEKGDALEQANVVVRSPMPGSATS